ncbi:unnamed protein product [Mycena citricolor]|uniref:Phosphatidate phosphatase APP1 catalytic domain-containing protein n=1 Tax=Mycena citricolor TaxID=2018698 RepID=A0AAD2K3K1_9AGAR|nr:unnamed protein product [Mycena citricolor]
MRQTSFLLSFAAFASVNALPRGYAPPAERSSINALDDVLVFDAPAFDDPANPGNTLVQLQAYASTREVSISPLIDGVTSALKAIGLNVSSSTADTVTGRLALFATLGLSGKAVTVNVDGCAQPATLPSTASGGMAIQNVSVGACASGDAAVQGDVKLSGFLNNRNVNFTMFPSSNSGFGVISGMSLIVPCSELVSHTLDKLQLAQTTLIDTPVPVTGMPELYASLAKSLNSPQFVYVSGSPFQLYPFLRDFISTTYSASNGPIMLQNLTTTNIQDIINFAQSNGIFEYKSAMIDRIQGMYPGKKFLTIGDSTQKDPETYAEAIRKYGDFIACAWIRQVDGANNTAERFAAAFEGVPATKFKIYTDDEIPSLANIDVAGGSCS